ncbi:hypothetical protein M5K25_017702 [Dendrobium thyrsiflorum]|uniref:Uncharacterized protein n=1 Tax=Dendrobium thyrsiflorum TaxID=117978 RepID=A0ABD0UMZ8_DENTH
MAAKKVETLEGETNVKKLATMEESFSSMKNRFGEVEEMFRRILETQTKTLSVVAMANPNPDSIGIPLITKK